MTAMGHVVNRTVLVSCITSVSLLHGLLKLLYRTLRLLKLLYRTLHLLTDLLRINIGQWISHSSPITHRIKWNWLKLYGIIIIFLLHGFAVFVACFFFIHASYNIRPSKKQAKHKIGDVKVRKFPLSSPLCGEHYLRYTCLIYCELFQCLMLDLANMIEIDQAHIFFVQILSQQSECRGIKTFKIW